MGLDPAMTLIHRMEAFAAIPLTVLLLVLPPARFRIWWVDGPPQDMWGLPLPWMADSYLESGGTDIYLGPLVIDAVVVGALAWLLVCGLGRVAGWLRRGLAVLAWLAAVPLFLWMAFVTLFFGILAPELTDYALWYQDWPVDHIEGPLFTRPDG